MGLKYMEPAVTQEDIEQAKKVSGPRELAKKGKYRVRLHSIRGRLYEKDGETKDVMSLFFINLDGNFKGAELTFFRMKGKPASTTNARDMVTILRAAGLDDETVAQANWAVDTESDPDERGNRPAGFVTPDGNTVEVSGLEFVAYIDVDNRNPQYPKNIVKGLKAVPKEDLPL